MQLLNYQGHNTNTERSLLFLLVFSSLLLLTKVIFLLKLKSLHSFPVWPQTMYTKNNKSIVRSNVWPRTFYLLLEIIKFSSLILSKTWFKYFTFQHCGLFRLYQNYCRAPWQVNIFYCWSLSNSPHYIHCDSMSWEKWSNRLDFSSSF